ncbi:hypothetical protein BP5796_02798 [Coleophoma crateriformis]|uniref:ABM domain-containing protein n=1 Tax=Coleophoma crateriformis TaxID=565419 RepID=A0A3D8SZ79_9HELO|nr:hypothetical protein BP5796_02798 [Coleophoma crateriformis]
MPILEVLQVRLKPGTSPQDPTLLANLRMVRSRIGTNSRFYICIEDPTLLFILGQWPTLDAHRNFLKSPERDEILSAQDDQLEFRYMIHLEFGGMETLPLHAPVMALARLFINPEGKHPNQFLVKVQKHRHVIVDGSQAAVVDGWRVDGTEAEREYWMFTGWDSREAHDIFREKTRSEIPEYKSIRDHYLGMDVLHAKDLEVLSGESK